MHSKDAMKYLNGGGELMSQFGYGDVTQQQMLQEYQKEIAWAEKFRNLCPSTTSTPTDEVPNHNDLLLLLEEEANEIEAL